MPNLISLVGQRFSRLLVVARAPNGPSGQTAWRCICDCGALVDVVAMALKARRSATQSCGCLKRELDRGMAQRMTTHGHAARGRRYRSPEYNAWAAAIQRCTNPKNGRYRDYGGRGITVYRGWRDSFAAFLFDVGPRPSPKHSLDRRDNDRGYEPGNVRWATRVEQDANKRRRRPLRKERVAAILDKYASEAPDLIARLRKELGL